MKDWKHIHQRIVEPEKSKTHRDSADAARQNRKKQHGAKGRGSLVTLLSKDAFDKVVDVISQLIKATIAEEVRQAGMFSVQIDTTRDISSRDQCSIILRYLTDVIHERLIATVECESSTRQHFSELLKKVLQELNIDTGTCVGNSTDGAANMQEQYHFFFFFFYIPLWAVPPIRFIYGVMPIFWIVYWQTKQAVLWKVHPSFLCLMI